MLPSCNWLLFFLFLMTAYGNTLTIRSTINSTDLESVTSTEYFDGQSCSSSVECAENLECRESLCQCSESEYWDNSKCSSNVCAIEQCSNGGKCQISEEKHKCFCADGYLGDKCQYADGRSKDFIVIYQEVRYSPSPAILPASNRRATLFIFYFANNKNISITLNSTDDHYILDSNVLLTDDLHQAGAEIHSNVSIILNGFIFRIFLTEGFFVLPTRFASTDYIIPSFTVSTK
ncbi:unnamed protein product [Mytilus coruscus]|uniref:EGF-like domain-containing protein n=1 Tax=Mytilus coruscus TaxID=42192 RepID=A0A6J8AQ18_MYTCO|nr:unnamed protein product [Mytilus coruscus]